MYSILLDNTKEYSKTQVDNKLNDYTKCKIVTKTFFFEQNFVGYLNVYRVAYTQLGITKNQIKGVSFVSDTWCILGSFLGTDELFVSCYSGNNYSTSGCNARMLIFYN